MQWSGWGVAMRVQRATGLVIGVVVCLSGTISPSVQAVPTRAEPATAAPAAAAPAPGYQELERALEPIQGLASSLFPAQFGGLWATGSGEDVTVHIAFTDTPLVSTAALVSAAGFPYPEVLEPVDVAVSLAQLEQLLELMSAEREAVRAGELAIGTITSPDYDLAVDLPTNSVQVITDVGATEQVLWQTAFASYGALVDVVPGSITGPQGCRRADCGTNLRGGLQLGSDGGKYCSSAFTVQKNGERRLLSAGHCGNASSCDGHDDGAARFHNGRRYGTVIDQACARHVDAEIHSPNSDFAFRPWLTVNRRDPKHPVVASTEWTETIEGLTRICKSGYASSLRCGQVTNKYLAPSYVPLSSRFVMTNYCAIPGDSGAAVHRRIRKGRAEGIHAGGNVDGPARCKNWNPRRDFSVYGHIEYALEALDVTMVFDR